MPSVIEISLKGKKRSVLEKRKSSDLYRTSIEDKTVQIEEEEKKRLDISGVEVRRSQYTRTNEPRQARKVDNGGQNNSRQLLIRA